MKARTALTMLLPALLLAQFPAPETVRPDPSWFGPSAVLQPGKAVDLQWVSPGLALQGRTIRVAPLEAPVWQGPRRKDPDRNFLRKVEDELRPLLEKGLRKGLAGFAAVSSKEGDLLLTTRVVDAQGGSEEMAAPGSSSLTLALKLSDARTGALLGAFQHTLVATSDRDLLTFLEVWSRDLGRSLKTLPGAAATPGAPPAPDAPAMVPARPPQPPPPAPPAAKSQAQPFDLAVTLARLEALRQDGILTEEEYRALKAKAEARAK